MANSIENQAGRIYVPFGELNKTYGITYCRVHVNRLMERGEFPMAIKLSPNRIAWRAQEIEDWLASRPAARSVRGAAVAAA